MGKVKYKKIPKDLESIVAPVLKGQHTRKSIYSVSAEVSEHYILSVDVLVPFRLQARSNFSDKEIEELSQSIKRHGVRQPLTVIPSPTQSEKYEVVSGERRLRAAKKIGLDKVPCILIQNYSDAEEIALIENIQREDLHPIEIGVAFKEILRKNKDLTNSDLAKKIGVSKQYVSDSLSYCKIPKDICKKFIEKGIRSRDILRSVLRKENQKEFLEKIISKKGIEHPSISILRITKLGESFNIQYNGLKKISEEELKNLKKELDKIFYDISEL